jgi:signal transduction histidine kinase
MIVMQSGWLYGFLSAALLALVGLALRLKKELDRVHAELARAEQKALRASRAKNEFLTNMSHELRTPLNAIIGMTDLLAEAPLDKEQEKYLRICRRASRSLLSIVTDLLDLSQLESGQLEIEIVEFDLRSLVQSVIEMIEIRAFEKGLSLTFTVSPELPRVVRGDFNHLRKILLNLLGNAIKFTEEGQVSLTVAPGLFSSRRESSAADERLGDGDERICFVVRDTGVGIPEAALSTIFDEFTQADASVTRAYGGTGLGLAICHRWVQAMGGIIQVRSRPGQGSEFAVTVPLERPRRLQLLKTSEQSVTATPGSLASSCTAGAGREPTI